MGNHVNTEAVAGVEVLVFEERDDGTLVLVSGDPATDLPVAVVVMPATTLLLVAC